MDCEDLMLKFSVILALLLSCVYPAPIYPAEARQSSFEIVENMTVDATQIGEGTISKTFLGTAWISKTTEKSSDLITAGHVCKSLKVIPVSVIDYSTFTVKTVALPVTSDSYELRDRNGNETPVKIVLDDDKVDLCMLRSAKPLGFPLEIADNDPPYASSTWDISAAGGLWGGGVAPIIDLKYAGRGKIWGDDVEALVFTGLAQGGASGSAIMYQGRVVAVLTEASTNYIRMASGVPHEVVQKFIDRAEAQKTN